MIKFFVWTIGFPNTTYVPKYELESKKIVK